MIPLPAAIAPWYVWAETSTLVHRGKRASQPRVYITLDVFCPDNRRAVRVTC